MSMVEYIPNLLLGEQVARSAEMEHACEEAAGDISTRAQEIAPVDTGAFQESIHAEGTTVVASDPGAIYIELGTSDTEAHHTLTQAAESVGLQVGQR